MAAVMAVHPLSAVIEDDRALHHPKPVVSASPWEEPMYLHDHPEGRPQGHLVPTGSPVVTGSLPQSYDLDEAEITGVWYIPRRAL
jgi:hypothetical protein